MDAVLHVVENIINSGATLGSSSMFQPLIQIFMHRLLFVITALRYVPCSVCFAYYMCTYSSTNRHRTTSTEVLIVARVEYLHRAQFMHRIICISLNFSKFFGPDLSQL